MKLLIDENLPRQLKRHLTEYDCATVQEMGWSGTKNGALLRLAEPVFDVFVTLDQNLPYQQHLKNLALAIVVLQARSNRLVNLEPLVPGLKTALDTIEPGQPVIITYPPEEA